MALAEAASLPVKRRRRDLVLLALTAGSLAVPLSARAQRAGEMMSWRERMLAGEGMPAEWNAYAHALYGAGRYRESVGAFQRAMQLGVAAPDSASWNVARAYAHAGDSRQAFRWMERALDLGFRDRRAIRREPAFERFRGQSRFRELVDGVVDARRRPLAKATACSVHCARSGGGTDSG